jgi:uncharacterized protein (DUF433 family)
MEAFPFRAAAQAESYREIDRIPVSVLLDRVRSLYNVGAFFRSADAAGVEKLYLTGYTGRPPHDGISKTALGAEQAVEWEHRWDPLPLIESLRESGRQIAAVETTLHSVDLYDWEPDFPVCLVRGRTLRTSTEVPRVARGLANCRFFAAGSHVINIPSNGVCRAFGRVAYIMQGMALRIQSERPPLQVDDEDVCRVGGTRVTLDTLVAAFRQGSTAEEIALQYPALSLTDVYATIAYYLQNRQEIDVYLADRGAEALRTRDEIEKRFPPAEIRERLLARRKPVSS